MLALRLYVFRRSLTAIHEHACVAALWRAGCIIRSRFLNDITAAYRREPKLANLLLDPFFAEEVRRYPYRAVLAGASS